MRFYRHRIGLSQDSLADKALLHRSYVGAVERGKRNICLANLARIAAALEVEPCKLLASRHCCLKPTDETVTEVSSNYCKGDGSYIDIDNDMGG
ncbi:MAG: helix-turn-helix transcriptional regulator [bacterium]|nr:helix-turn-helix transcriptional regulator [bacterium]